MIAAACVVIASLAVTGLLDAQAQSDGLSSGPIPSGLAERFGVLAKSSGDSGLATMATVTSADHTAGRQAAEDALPVGTELFAPEAAREAQLDSSDARVWAAPSREGGICALLLPAGSRNLGPAASCGGPEDSKQGAAITYGGGFMGGSKDQVAAGIVPNGVSEVVAKLADGSLRILPVKDNAFVGRFAQAATKLSYRQGDDSVDLLAGIEGS